jgi:hypothetical protein
METGRISLFHLTKENITILINCNSLEVAGEKPLPLEARGMTIFCILERNLQSSFAGIDNLIFVIIESTDSLSKKEKKWKG